MRQQQRGSEPEPTRTREPANEEDLRRIRKGNWADEASKARTADDPRAVAPRDRAGRPSTGDETL
ncbi:MAG TPA: hypothetical protein VFX61_11670 [Micromonosporaceae bacterium]|nr:hypothetical protein [Micromonosporaceae bacterium]